jgi:hypothetical protein
LVPERPQREPGERGISTDRRQPIILVHKHRSITRPLAGGCADVEHAAYGRSPRYTKGVGRNGTCRGIARPGQICTRFSVGEVSRSAAAMAMRWATVSGSPARQRQAYSLRWARAYVPSARRNRYLPHVKPHPVARTDSSNSRHCAARRTLRGEVRQLSAMVDSLGSVVARPLTKRTSAAFMSWLTMLPGGLVLTDYAVWPGLWVPRIQANLETATCRLVAISDYNASIFRHWPTCSLRRPACWSMRAARRQPHAANAGEGSRASRRGAILVRQPCHAEVKLVAVGPDYPKTLQPV